MLLNRILDDMNENGELSGETDFEALALAGTYSKANVLTFVEHPKYASSVSKNSVALTVPETAHLLNCRGICVCDNPRLLFFKIHNILSFKDEYKRKSERTQVGSNCSISPLAFVAANNVKIGDNVVIEEFVSIKENTVIGNDCVIRAGTVIGGEGFEFKRDGDRIMPVTHAGGVIIGDSVEIQQLAAIDKAIFPWDDTVIGDYCKIDNLVYIAHAVKLNKRILVVANSFIGGRTVIGEDVWIGASATVINGIAIGSGARVNVGAVATKSVPDNESVTGNFAIEHSKFIRNLKDLSQGNK